MISEDIEKEKELWLEILSVVLTKGPILPVSKPNTFLERERHPKRLPKLKNKKRKFFCKNSHKNYFNKKKKKVNI